MMKGEEFIGNNGKWEFNEDTANVFEDMLQRSIPEYKSMRMLTFNIAMNFLKNDSKLLDVGCSDGLSLQYFIDFAEDHKLSKCNFIGVDISDPMIKKAKFRFKELKNVNVKKMDLRYEFPIDSYDIITSILTLQFIPINYRQRIIKNIYDNLNVNGVFLFVEKVIGESYAIDELFIEKYHDIKHQNGYSYEEINGKREALEGVLVPVTDQYNKQLLKQAGFKLIDTYWRYLNFEGIIAIKD